MSGSKLAGNCMWGPIMELCWPPSLLSTLQGRGNTKAVQKIVVPFVAQWSLYVPPGFNIHKSNVLPTQCIYVFCVDLRTAIISPYSINWLVLITEKCLLRGTDWIFKCNSGRFSRVGCAIAQAFGCRPLTAQARVRSQDSPMSDLWFTKWHWDMFLSQYCGFPCQYHFTSALYSCPSARCFCQKGQRTKLGNRPKKDCSFRNYAALVIEKYFPLFRA
jgi:hypothetical protein